MSQQVTAIVDIGKTNKKFFLFDEDLNEVYNQQMRLDELRDEDGYPCDDLDAILKWVAGQMDVVMSLKEVQIKKINFSTYGASFVHIDKAGKPLTPLYNYTKPFPESLREKFNQTYGDEATLALETASPYAGMLNSGMQLYWLKHAHPEVYEKVHYSLHFPQYLSYFFTNHAVSDFTSIGCHTSLWDYSKKTYHSWVYKEGIDQKLPRIVPTTTVLDATYKGHALKAGVGIHDSSSALLPYLKCEHDPFILVSTGTWSISLNPFNNELLSREELENGCLCYMQTTGTPVKASRLFLGNEHAIQVARLEEYFNKEKGAHLTLKFDESLNRKLSETPRRLFKLETIQGLENVAETNPAAFSSFEEAYHQLMIELIELQVNAIQLAQGRSEVATLFIDGGFADNDLYLNLLSAHFREYSLCSTKMPLGTALGAAMVVSDRTTTPDLVKRKIKRHFARIPD